MGNQIQSCIADGALSPHDPNSHMEMKAGNGGKSEWKRDWQEHLVRLQKSVRELVAEGHDNVSDNAKIFHALMQLYAHKDIISDLYTLCETDNGLRAMTFYVPQLATFLMKGGFEHSEKLQQLFLHISARDPRFAHRLMWFLLAFCSYDEANPHEQSLMLAIEANGGVSVEKLANLLKAKMKTPETDKSAVVVEDVGIVDSVYNRSPNNSDAPLPKTPDTVLTDLTNEGQGLGLPSPPMVESSSNPPPVPANTILSPIRGSVAAANRRSSLTHHSPGHFKELLHFTEGLTSLSDSLRLLPGYERSNSLKQGLAELGDSYLPSNYLYLPLQVTFRGNINDNSGTQNFHNIVGLHGEESIVFSTKERCPYLVTLEIVDVSQTDPAEDEVEGEDGTILRRVSDGAERPTIDVYQERLTKWWENRKTEFEEFAKESLDKYNNNNTNKKADQMNQTDSAYSVKSLDDRNPNNPDPNSSVGNFNDDGQQRATRSSSAPSLDRDVSMSSTRSSFNDLGQWETFEIADDADKNLNKKGLAQGKGSKSDFGGLADCIMIDDALFGAEGQINPNPKPDLNSAQKEPSTPDRSYTTSGYENDSEDLTPIKPQKKNLEESGRQGSGLLSETETDHDDIESDQEPEPLLFSESWQEKEARIRAESSYGHLPGWRLVPIIMVAQIVKAIGNILKEAKVPVYTRPYDIIATQLGGTGGLIEAVPDTVSIDSLKRRDPSFTTLDDFFVRHFGRGVRSSQGYRKARRNFVASMAGYAVICYLLQIKDRHNGNILLDNEGHIVHIDWGFVFMSSPGKNLNFEAAPFKLTSEFVALMGGSRSSSFRRFRRLTARAFLELRKRREEIILLVEMLSIGNEDLECFRKRPQAAIAALRERFRPDLTNDNALIRYVDGLINQSLSNWSTKWYDEYQMCCVGIAA
ncbi:hypothetical protein TL16_g05040 [Triparma laevis f. inornata]|uniref:1-phosphatidylinositol 4-kinase n=1 Tax=Triparma laevis f. inornata TaxID=1714386 RepID=A0A9W7AFE9_9STRA|nr:hypothetical protein TL16_g05040 [Triparma laevis f. inornata]